MPTIDEKYDAYIAGASAFNNKKSRDDNPFTFDSGLRQYWDDGFFVRSEHVARLHAGLD